MTDGGLHDEERRLLILAPTGRDGVLTQAILEGAGVRCLVCRDGESLLREAGGGAGAILVSEEAIGSGAGRMLADFLVNQPSWSDLPVLIVTRPGADSATVGEAVATLGNVTLLERPVRVATLVSAARAVLRARDRQYELRERLDVTAWLAAIVESSEDAIISKTLDGVIVSWNTGAERLFGYSSAEAVGRPITLIIPPEKAEEERTIVQRLSRGERIDHIETVRVSKDGGLIDVSLIISPVRDTTGRIIGASKVARDITQRKQTEDALRDANRRKDEFLATLAHELRNPLAPIRNSLHILRLAESSDSVVDQVREMMERQVNHMVRLVDDLVEISRITQGKIELRKERVELADVIRSAVEASGPLIESGGHQLTLDLPSEPLTLDADPVRLAQVFANLLNNAAKYSDAGGQIGVTVRCENAGIVVSVRDTGIGIPADMLSAVFEMFTQGDTSLHRTEGGLGIGLTLVQKLVQMHGGSVTAMSEGPGKGSEFVVRLPLEVDDRPAETKPVPTASVDLFPIRVLVVDDNQDAADSLGMLLKVLGAEVHIVHDGSATLTALESFRPAVVMLDIGMPGMDGYEVARRIREQPRFRDVMLIALTGWGQDEDRRRSRTAGFDHHLIKPADVDALQALMVSLGNHE